MSLGALAAVRDLGRVHDIATILIRYGFGDMVRRLGLGGALKRAGRVLHWREANDLAMLEPPARIRRALEEMGPTFVKLGQVLATRIDLFPPEYIHEFEKLQDQVPPVPFEQISAQLEEDLGAPVDTVFHKVSRKALAAASIAQVHRAHLESGENVILKIRKPGIQKTVEADLRLLDWLAGVVEEHMEELRRFQPREIVSEFSRSLRQELDLAQECRNADRIAANFRDYPNIRVPRVYWEWTSERLNVQELIEGIPGRDLVAVDQAGLNRKLLAEHGAEAVLKMVFEDGFFHADPHPGNVFYLPENRIAFVDFGMVGRLAERRQRELVDVLFAIVKRQPEKAAGVLALWSGAEETKFDVLSVEIDGLIDRVHGVAISQLDLPQIITDLVALLRRHKLILPPDLTLLSKAFISLDGMGRQLDPDFQIIATAEPFLRRAMMERYTPKAVFHRSQEDVLQAVWLMSGLPKELHGLLRAARKGQFAVKIDVERADSYLTQTVRAIGLLTMGIVIAALIVGSSIVMTAAGSEIPFGLTAFAMMGFAGAVLGGFWLLLSLWRKR